MNWIDEELPAVEPSTCPNCGIYAPLRMVASWCIRTCPLCGWTREWDIDEALNDIMEEEADAALDRLRERREVKLDVRLP